MVLDLFLELLGKRVVTVEKLLDQGVLLLVNRLDFVVAPPHVGWRAFERIRRV